MGHLKAEHRMDRNYLWFRRGDAALAAAGYNFRRLIRLLLRQIFSVLTPALQTVPVRGQSSSRTTTDQGRYAVAKLGGVLDVNAEGGVAAPGKA